MTGDVLASPVAHQAAKRPLAAPMAFCIFVPVQVEPGGAGSTLPG